VRNAQEKLDKADAFDATDYAEWAVVNARTAVLDAIDGLLHTEELAAT
jgi:hypothetical protein